MRPHPNDFHDVAVFENLVHETMLNGDAARIRSAQITDKLFVAWRSLEGVLFKNLEEFFGFRFQSGSHKLLGVIPGLFGLDKRPLHQGSSVEHFSTGVLRPRTIDSRIFGMESRYNVSWIASQSSIERRTPAFFFPTMWIGS